VRKVQQKKEKEKILVRQIAILFMLKKKISYKGRATKKTNM